MWRDLSEFAAGRDQEADGHVEALIIGVRTPQAVESGTDLKLDAYGLITHGRRGADTTLGPGFPQTVEARNPVTELDSAHADVT